jgi:hypothetical protein
MRRQFASSLRQPKWSEKQQGGNALQYVPALTAILQVTRRRSQLLLSADSQTWHTACAQTRINIK